jgi:hypothetical protein
MHNINYGQKYVWAFNENFKNPLGKNSANLVTLATTSSQANLQYRFFKCHHIVRSMWAMFNGSKSMLLLGP